MFGIPTQDMMLPIACSIGGVIGSLAQAMVATIQLDGPPNRLGILQEAPPELAKMRGAWMVMRMFIGGVLGFVFGLYFIGTLNDQVGTFAKIWALSFVVGYAAPKIWVAQERALLKKLDLEPASTDDSPPSGKPNSQT